MFPFLRHSWIFKSRWIALLWAAGICWMAVQVADPGDGNATGADANTDISGAPVNPEDVKRIEDGLKQL